MFAELARYVLSKGGVIFGCTMERIEDGFDVKHIYIDNEKDLKKLQGSKYVQSRLGNTLKVAKNFLDNGRFVLFSGTPCQIAGLKGYLKQDYENLLTVDLSCTGTPSLKVFNDYIKLLEEKYKQKIIKFAFRNKEKMGWCCGNALITFQNGKQKIIYNNTSSYLNLFIRKKIQGDCCRNCKFEGLERFSDFTLADAWGIEQVYPSLLKENGGIFDKNNGISLVLINSKRGTKHFNLIEDNVIFKEVDVEKLKQFNGPLCERTIMNETMEYLEAYKAGGYEALDRLFRKKQGFFKRFYYLILPYIPKFVKTIYKKLRGQINGN